MAESPLRELLRSYQERGLATEFCQYVLGTLVVEIEAEDGTVGFAVTTGGEPAAYIVEKHLARFLEGRAPTDYEKIWDQMYFSTQYYGRKGLVVNAISGVILLMADATTKMINPVFYVKMAFIFLAVWNVRIAQKKLRAGIESPMLAWISIFLWIGATTAGRLMAYIGPVAGLE